jgi:hypothetical protein
VTHGKKKCLLLFHGKRNVFSTILETHYLPADIVILYHKKNNNARYKTKSFEKGEF